MLSIVLVILFVVTLRWITGKKSDNVSLLLGKTAIVTGGNEGIGFAMVQLLASRGCKVIIADKANSEKNAERAKKLTKNNDIISKHLDLSSFASVRKFAEEIKMTEKKIDILINNAGINPYNWYITEDGLSSVMQVNYFGAFLLTHLLLDQLKESEQGRIIFAGSTLAFFNNQSVDNLDGKIFLTYPTIGIQYSNSKYCNILAAQEFGRRLRKFNITVNSADPGIIRSRIFNVENEYRWWAAFRSFILWIFGSEPMTGAQTAFHLAASDDMRKKTGGNYCLCGPWLKPMGLRDRNFCEKIWKKSEQLVQLKPEEKII